MGGKTSKNNYEREVKPEGRVDIFRYNPEDIIANQELRGREVKPDLDGLKTSIREHGQLQAVLCRRGDKGQPILIFGFSRLEVIKQLKKEEPDKNWTIMVKFTASKVNEQAGFAMALAENMARNDLTPLDKAAGVTRMRNVYHMTIAEVARALARSSQWVSSMEKLQALPPDLHRRLRSGDISVSTAHAIAENAKLKTPEDRAKAIAAGQAKKAENPGRKKQQVTKSDLEGQVKTTPTVPHIKRVLSNLTSNHRISAGDLFAYLDGQLTTDQFKKQFAK